MENGFSFKRSADGSRVGIDFSDYEKLTRFPQGPQIEIIQLEPGNFLGHFFHQKLENFNFTLFHVNRSVKYCGVSPQNRWSFVLFVRSGIRQSLWNYPDVTEDCIIVLPPRSEIYCASKSAVEMVTIHADEELLYRVCQSLELSEPRILFGNTKQVFACSSVQRKRLCNLVSRLYLGLISNPDTAISSDYFSRPLEWEVLVCLVRTVSELLDISAKPLPLRRFLALQTAETYMRKNLHDPVHLGDICQVANVSQRTLTYIFQDYYGIAPKAYMKRIRLNAVHKQLKQANSARQAVSAIAHNFGFTHMSQFAQDYQKHFGKLPSQVLKGQ